MKKKNHNFKDISGQTFAWVFVEGYAGSSSGGAAKWNCKCLLCGKSFIAYGKNLRSGKTVSCGCYRDAVAKEKFYIDITGQKYNRWFVKEYSHRDKWGANIWHCICECGNEGFVSTSQLISGHSQSCGCLRRQRTSEACAKDLRGKQCGMLIPKERVGVDDEGNVLWRCECINCHGEAIVSSYHLTSGRVISCGCIRSKNEMVIRAVLDKYHIKYQTQKRFVGCKNLRSLPFDIYVPDYNMAIEYDGEFHYEIIDQLHNDLEYQIQNDDIKTKYCEENDIILLRIPYWEKDNIESILSDWLFLNDGEEANSSTADLSV